MCGDRRRRCWAETWDSGDAGVAGVGVGTDFVSLTTLWRAYRRQRYRSWSSADAEGAFCVVCVQFLALCRRWAQQASLLGQVLDCRRRRECTQWCWSASVWQLGAAGEVMSPIPTHYHVWYGYAYELRDYGAQGWYARGVLCGAHAGFGCAYHCGDCGLRNGGPALRYALCGFAALFVFELILRRAPWDFIPR